MIGRVLNAWWQRGTRIGAFVEEDTGQIAFRYTDHYSDLPISVSLPVAGEPVSHMAARNFLENLLPESDAARARIARRHGLSPGDTFGLLGVIGRECAGALILLPPDEAPEEGAGQYEVLTREMFERWHELREHQPLMTDRHGRVRLSLAGAQPKAVLYFDDSDRPFLPLDGAPSSHIVKPAIRRARPNTVYIEWYCMHLAAAVLGPDQVAKTDCWWRSLRVRRFDRRKTDDGLGRVHQEDLCQALGLGPGEKYENSARVADLRQTLIARAASLIERMGEQGLVRAPAIEKQALLRRLIINALLLNADAHLKNFALVYGPDGFIRMAPLYDVVCTLPIRLTEGGDAGWEREPVRELALERELPMAIGQARYIDEISDEDWRICGTRQLGLTARFVRQELDTLRATLSAHAGPVADRLLDREPRAEPAITAVRECVVRQH